MDARQLFDQAERLFSKRSALMLLWQEIAENFYPQRADFTITRTYGEEFADNLLTSYPLIIQREFQDQLGSMLRNTSKNWFKITVNDEKRLDGDGRAWLQWSSNIMRKAMYRPTSRFTKAMKEGDGDYAAFGQTITSNRMNKMRDGLLYNCYHLRDVVWQENDEGGMAFIARKWKPDARTLYRKFGDKVHPDVRRAATEKNPFEEYQCYHFEVEADMYSEDARGRPYFSIYYDADHNIILEAIPVWNKEYNVERWQTVSGSQYAFSPSAVAGLPEARTLQAMTYTLLEAGEKVTSPPMIATIDAVRSDVAVYAGGLTWIDRDYDEKLGEALRPLTQDMRGMPLGIEMQKRSEEILKECFYLNKLSLPTGNPQMTAFEVGQYVQEYIRGALPLFEPMEAERNGQICEATFKLMFRNGFFGSPFDIPKSLRGLETQFHFSSPLHDAIEEQKGTTFAKMGQIIQEAIALDQGVAAIPDAVTAVRETLVAIGVPETWLRSEVAAADIQKQQQAAAAAQQTLQAMESGSKSVQNLAGAAKDQATAGLQPQATGAMA